MTLDNNSHSLIRYGNLALNAEEIARQSHVQYLMDTAPNMVQSAGQAADELRANVPEDDVSQNYVDASQRFDMAIAYLQAMNRAEKAQHVKPEKPKGKRMGVWVDGVLKFQSRDRDEIDRYAAFKMKAYTKVIQGKAHVITHNVWVAPIGSFEDVQGGKA